MEACNRLFSIRSPAGGSAPDLLLVLGCGPEHQLENSPGPQWQYNPHTTGQKNLFPSLWPCCSIRGPCVGRETFQKR